MKCYIKNRFDFITNGVYDVSEYDIYLHTIFDDKSKITITTHDIINAGDFIYTDSGWVGIIEKVSPSKTNTIVQLICKDILNLFDDDWAWFSDIFIGAPETEVSNIIYNYRYLNEYMNNFPFIREINTTYTPPILYPDLEKGLYNAKNFIQKVLRLRNIFTEFSIGRESNQDTLKITITKKDEVIRKIDFSDKDYALISNNQSNDSVALVVCAIWYEDSLELVQTNWYLYPDGSVSNIPPTETDYVDGIRKVIFVNSSDNQETKALDEIAKHKYSHRIEFSSMRELNFYDLLELRINGQILYSFISSVRVKSDSNRFFYTSGELRTKFTDKIKELII